MEQVRENLSLFMEKISSKLESYGYTFKEKRHLVTYIITAGKDTAEITLFPKVKAGKTFDRDGEEITQMEISFSVKATSTEFADTIMTIMSDDSQVVRTYN